MWLLFKIQQHFAHREVWTRVYRYLSHTQPLHMEKHEHALVGLTESWQELFDKSIQVKRAARRVLEAAGRDKRGHSERGYEEQPPTDTLIPPARPAWEEPRGTPGQEGMKGPPLPKKNRSSPGTYLSERSQAEARQSAVEAVRRITSSCSSLESSSKSERGGMDGGDWDPTYDGFALEGRGSRARTSPLEDT